LPCASHFTDKKDEQREQGKRGDMDRCTLLGLLTGLCWFALPGCETETAAPVLVRGKVYYRNAPLRGGVIVFTPDPVRNGDGPMSHAEIQSDGTYTLRTDSALGAVPGWHRVTVTAFPNAVPALPSRFSDPEQSGLNYEVKPRRENIIDIYLE
jgi:hypothetical protein